LVLPSEEQEEKDQLNWAFSGAGREWAVADGCSLQEEADCAYLPVATSQSFNSPGLPKDPPAEATVLPSGLYATDRTASACPRRVARSLLAGGHVPDLDRLVVVLRHPHLAFDVGGQQPEEEG
jgi:hypothetical protein